MKRKIINGKNAIKNENAILTTEKANIDFLGLSISKASYSTTMWVLFLGTLAVAGILFFRFKNANAITKHSKSVLKDLEEEYESYRRVCIEREQGLRRQLFEEAKKFKELKKNVPNSSSEDEPSKPETKFSTKSKLFILHIFNLIKKKNKFCLKI